MKLVKNNFPFQKEVEILKGKYRIKIGPCLKDEF